MPTDAIQPFDWQRIFLGDLPLTFLGELVFRTVWMYLFALVVTRFAGKRAIGDMTSFDYIIVIAIGSSTGDPMLMPEIPLLHGMVVLSIVVILERALAELSRRSSKIEKATNSTPSPLVRDGQIVKEWLEREHMTYGELFSLLRLQGVRDVGQVERAYLEPTGSLSVFCYPDEEAREVHSTFPPRHIEENPL